MNNLVVITFPNADDAERAREALRSVQKSGHLRIDDTAVLVKDATGEVRVQNEIDRGIKTGAIGGGLLGLLIGFMFPIAGLAVGAAGGALVGRLVGLGVDQKFVDEVTSALTPGSSALFATVGGGDPEIAIAALEPFTGTLRHTSLPPNIEEGLRDALR